jgi:hypothetical protein
MPRRIARLRESGNLAWSVAASIISLIAIAPVIAIGVLALGSSGDAWPHLMANVLPGALRRTLGLIAGVGTLSLLIGTGTAWLVLRPTGCTIHSSRRPSMRKEGSTSASMWTGTFTLGPAIIVLPSRERISRTH